MAITGKLLILMAAAAFLVTLFSVSHADQATATFYNTLLPSACYGNKDQGVMIAAASSELWKNGKTCGKKIRVSCVGATNDITKSCKHSSAIEVTIVDFCPNCRGTIDLSQQAFAKIADPNAGKIKIQIDQV